MILSDDDKLDINGLIDEADREIGMAAEVCGKDAKIWLLTSIASSLLAIAKTNFIHLQSNENH